MVDHWIKKYRDGVKACKTAKDIDMVLNKLYVAGYQDGLNDKQNKEKIIVTLTEQEITDINDGETVTWCEEDFDIDVKKE